MRHNRLVIIPPVSLGNHTNTAASQYDVNGQSLRDSATPSLVPTAPVYNVQPTFNLTVAPEVPISIQSDASRLADYVDFQARASAASFEQSLTLALSSGQSAGR